ncbi:MAG: hypothetical protein U0744_03870 [Gemmataceae bacterium]
MGATAEASSCACGTDSLAEIVNRKHWKAQSGEPGGTSNCHGKNGEDLVMAVPPGTVIYDRDRGHVLRDLSRPMDEVVVAWRKGRAAIDRSPVPPIARRGSISRARTVRNAG